MTFNSRPCAVFNDAARSELSGSDSFPDQPPGDRPRIAPLVKFHCKLLEIRTLDLRFLRQSRLALKPLPQCLPVWDSDRLRV